MADDGFVRLVWSRRAPSKALPCLITSLSFNNLSAFASMSVCKISLFKPQMNWSLMLTSEISTLQDGHENSQSIAAARR